MLIGDRNIDGRAPAFIIAEAGVNHDGDPARARTLVAAAARAGADAVKFQTFRAEELVTAAAPQAAYQRRATGRDDAQIDMLRRLELAQDDFRDLVACARDEGIVFLSTPFDAASADFLVDLGVPAIKMSSGDLTHAPLLAHVAQYGRPLLISTGMSVMDEVAEAVATVRAAGDPPLALLHCVSDYPARPCDANLRAIPAMRERFGVPVGWSDHTPGSSVTLAAVALGASIIEKHLTLDRSAVGPDHHASLEPDAFAALVRGVREVESALGDGRKVPVAGEAEIARVARRSIVAACDIPAGTTVDASMLTYQRPGTGLPPTRCADVIGHVAVTAVPAGTLLTPEMVQ